MGVIGHRTGTADHAYSVGGAVSACVVLDGILVDRHRGRASEASVRFAFALGMRALTGTVDAGGGTLLSRSRSSRGI